MARRSDPQPDMGTEHDDHEVIQAEANLGTMTVKVTCQECGQDLAIGSPRGVAGSLLFSAQCATCGYGVDVGMQLPSLMFTNVVPVMRASDESDSGPRD